MSVTPDRHQSHASRVGTYTYTFTLVLQDDGDLVEYRDEGIAVSQSGTSNVYCA